MGRASVSFISKQRVGSVHQAAKQAFRLVIVWLRGRSLLSTPADHTQIQSVTTVLLGGGLENRRHWVELPLLEAKRHSEAAEAANRN